MLRVLAVSVVSCAFLLSLSLATHAQAESQYPRVVTGTVTDVDGKPIEGARVENGFFSARAADREFVLTDAQGKYHLEINKAGRDYRLGISARGYTPQYMGHFIPGPASKPTEHNATLADGARLNLRITTRNGHPVKGLQVRPTTPSSGFHSGFSSPVPQTPLPGKDRARITDADGRVTFDSLPSMPASLYAADFKGARRPTPWLGFQYRRPDARGHQTYNLSIEEAAKARPGEPVIIEVSDYHERETRDGFIEGRVVDEVTGKPIREFFVGRRYSTLAMPFSNDEGRFTIGGTLRRGRAYQTRIFTPGYAVGVERPVANTSSTVQEQTFALKQHPSFFGRLVDTEGKPIVGVEIVTGVAPKNRYRYIEWSALDSYADGRHSLKSVLRVKTDEDGEFCVPESPQQKATIIIKADGYARQVIIPLNRPRVDHDGYVEIALVEGATLIAVADRGTQLGKLADGVSLQCQPIDGFNHMFRSSKLDDEGKRSYASMAPGSYTVSLHSGNGNMSYSCYSTTVRLKSGEETQVILGEMFGSLKLSGSASPFSTLRITGSNTEKGPSRFAVHADVDGHFELSGLLPGPYRIVMDTSSASSGYYRGMGGVKTVEITKDTVVDLVPNRDLYGPFLKIYPIRKSTK